jgi:hypothetical protein
MFCQRITGSDPSTVKKGTEMSVNDKRNEINIHNKITIMEFFDIQLQSFFIVNPFTEVLFGFYKNYFVIRWEGI